MAISLPICFEFFSVRRPSVECGDEFITILHNNRRCLVSGGSDPVLGNLCHKTEVLGNVGEDVGLEPLDLCDVLHVWMRDHRGRFNLGSVFCIQVSREGVVKCVKKTVPSTVFQPSRCKGEGF